MLTILSAGTLPSCFADTRADEWITNARSAVGTESDLTALNSVRFIGTVEAAQKMPSKNDPVKLEEAHDIFGIDVIFQKPDQFRMVIRSQNATETIALYGYDGWSRRVENGAEDRANLVVLETAQIKLLRANIWANLFFYRGIEARGGRVDFQGETDVSGKTCVVLVFRHTSNISFTRYFDKSTKRLVKTVTGDGTEIREDGEIKAGGIRFPKRFTTISPDGQIKNVNFQRIEVNQPLPAAEFAMPNAIML